MPKRGERQGHGFSYEDKIIYQYNFYKYENYTGKFDAMTQRDNINVQIKYTIVSGEICIADYFRNKSIDENFILIMGFYKTNSNNHKRKIDEKAILVNKNRWQRLFEFKYDNQMKKEIADISNSYEDDDKWKIFMKKYKKLWGDDRIIQLRFKRDHKTQKRIQCAIPNRSINEFISMFRILTPNELMEYTDDFIYIGGYKNHPFQLLK
jgi:hypothetical protein